MSANQLHVNAAELLREPGLRRHVSATVEPADVDAAHEAIAGDVTAEFELVSTLDDIELVGTIEVPWRGQCRRCLRPLAEAIVIDVDERYAEQPAQRRRRVPHRARPDRSRPDDSRARPVGGRRPPVVPSRLPRAVPGVRRRPQRRPVRLRRGGRRRPLVRPRPTPPAHNPTRVFAVIRVSAADMSVAKHSDGAKHSDRAAGSAEVARPVAWSSPNFVPETNDGRSQEEEVEVEES